jgi:hypothetical protein
MACLLQGSRSLLCFSMLLTAASAAASTGGPLSDLARAKERVPRDAWKGHDFASMSGVLTLRLREAGFRVHDCSSWSVSELQELQRRIFPEAEAEFLAVYEAAADNRRQRFRSLGELEAHWAALDEAVEAEQRLREVRRDGLCHEAVMWWVHHLAGPTQRRLASEGLRLPSLPTVRHAPRALTAPASAVHAEYALQGPCSACHVWSARNGTALRGYQAAYPCPDKCDGVSRCFFDPTCSTSPGVGCNAGGKGQDCRFCDTGGGAPACPATVCPDKCDGVNRCFFDPTCSTSPGVGCNAGGKGQDCRFCDTGGGAPMCPTP